MEEANEITESPGAKQESTLESRQGVARILPRAFIFGWVAGLIALGSGQMKAAFGAMAGALAAGVYVATYLGSHLSGIGDRTKVFDSRIARSAALRILLTAGGAWLSYLAGRAVLLAYLVSFAAGFLILLAMEIPGTRRFLKERVSE